MEVQIGPGRTADLNPNVANPDRPKPLRSRDTTPSAAVLASDRTSRTVKYASTYPSLCVATSGALLRVFPGYGFATLGLILTRPLVGITFCLDQKNIVERLTTDIYEKNFLKIERFMKHPG